MMPFRWETGVEPQQETRKTMAEGATVSTAAALCAINAGVLADL